MAKDRSPQCKQCRREGQKLFLKGERCLTDKCGVERRSYPPGEHGRGRIKQSEYLLQLREKQKARRYYGLLEKQFRRYYAEAIRMKGDSGENLVGLLERRLDAVVYRAKFVPTPFAARQFVNHGHVKVNGRRVNIPSYLVKPGDVVEVKEKSKTMELVVVAAQLAERDVPDYVETDHSKMTARLTRVPTLSEVPYAVQMEPNLVIEFYSR